MLNTLPTVEEYTAIIRHINSNNAKKDARLSDYNNWKVNNVTFDRNGNFAALYYNSKTLQVVLAYSTEPQIYQTLDMFDEDNHGPLLQLINKAVDYAYNGDITLSFTGYRTAACLAVRSAIYTIKKLNFPNAHTVIFEDLNDDLTVLSQDNLAKHGLDDSKVKRYPAIVEKGSAGTPFPAVAQTQSNKPAEKASATISNEGIWRNTNGRRVGTYIPEGRGANHPLIGKLIIAETYNEYNEVSYSESAPNCTSPK